MKRSLRERFDAKRAATQCSRCTEKGLSAYEKALRAHMARPLRSLLGKHVNPPAKKQAVRVVDSGQVIREDTYKRWLRGEDAPPKVNRRQRLKLRRASC